MGEMKVYAKCQLQQGVMFGPFVGEMCRGQMPTNLKYAWAVSRPACEDTFRQFKNKFLQIIVLHCNYV